VVSARVPGSRKGSTSFPVSAYAPVSSQESTEIPLIGEPNPGYLSPLVLSVQKLLSKSCRAEEGFVFWVKSWGIYSTLITALSREEPDNTLWSIITTETSSIATYFPRVNSIPLKVLFHPLALPSTLARVMSRNVYFVYNVAWAAESSPAHISNWVRFGPDIWETGSRISPVVTFGSDPIVCPQRPIPASGSVDRVCEPRNRNMNGYKQYFRNPIEWHLVHLGVSWCPMASHSLIWKAYSLIPGQVGWVCAARERIRRACLVGTFYVPKLFASPVERTRRATYICGEERCNWTCDYAIFHYVFVF